MCGIVAILRLDGRPPEPARLRRMCDAVAHRGPDAEGVEVFAPHTVSGVSAGLGHRRLSILDPSPAGTQPMAGRRGDTSVVFNGEIFNFKSLRADLEREGLAFRTGTDTEVLLSMYDALGADLLPKLNGMFAFVLWDGRTGSALVARDRYGVKPIYYFHRGDEVLIASELRGILAAMDGAPEIDPEALDLFLSLKFVPAPWSIYKGIRKLPAGHVMMIDGGGVRIRAWYELPSPSEREMCPADEARTELRRLLDDAVRLRMISDRPLGSFLSGGLDSSVVTALATRHTPRKFETFSITFPNEGTFDEAKHSRLVARHLGTEHHEIPVSYQDVLEVIPTVLDSQDEPFADATAVPTWLLSYHARKSIVVALSGDGADEVFAGYGKYRTLLLHSRYAALPAPVRDGLIGPIVRRVPDQQGRPLQRLVRSAQRFVERTNSDMSVQMLRLSSVYLPGDLAAIARPGAGLGRMDALLLPGIRAAMTGASDLVNQALRADIQLVLPDQMLVKMDRMGMRHGLEVRTPFLDYRVVELASRIRGEDKLRYSGGKRIVIAAFQDLLPPSILQRPKQGFELPIRQWFRGPLEPMFRELLEAPEVQEQPWIDVPAVRAMFEAHREERRDYTGHLWSALSLFWWFRRTAGGARWTA